MAMSEETARLKVELIGVDGLDNLRKKLEEVSKELLDLQGAYDRGEVKEKEFADQTRILEKSQADLARGIADVEKAFDVVAKAAEREAKAFADAAKAAERAADAEVQAAEKEVAAVLKAEVAMEAAFAREAAARQAAADREAAAALKAAEAEALRATKLEEGFKQTAGGAGNLQMAIQASGYAIQDFASAGGGLAQRLGSISNNIPQIVAGLGVGGPWGIAFSAAVASVAALAGVLMKLGPEAIDPAADRLKYLTGKIEELEKRPHKVAIDLQELEAARGEAKELKAALEAIERLRTSQTEAEQKSGKAVGEALAEAPGGGQAVSDALRRQLIQERETELRKPVEAAMKTLQEQREHVARLAAEGQDMLAAEAAEGIKYYQEQLKKAEKQFSESLSAYRVEGGGADIAAGKIVSGAQTGAGAVQAARQAELRRRLEQAGMGRTAAELGFATPEAVQATEREQRDYENQKRQADLRKQLDKKEEERQKAEVEALEQQLHNRDVTEKDLAKTTEDARKKQEAAEKRRLATLARRVGGGTLGEEAQAYAARVQERQPGISDADLRTAVQTAVEAEVAKRAPQLAPAERAGVVGAVTEQALAAPPEDVAARQAREARALPREQREEVQRGYTEEAQMRGANPQQAATIGRMATAAFEKSGDLQGSFLAAVGEFQQLMGRMLAQQEMLANGLQQVHQRNRGMQARVQTAQRQWGR